MKGLVSHILEVELHPKSGGTLPQYESAIGVYMSPSY